MAPPRPPPELVDDAIAEILLRLPPDEPRDLFRASVVCKPWRRLLTDAAFLHRYRRFHRAPPLLRFFFHSGGRGKPIVPRFIPTTAVASPFPRPVLDCQPWSAFDCRHGRVLLFKMPEIRNLTVWDPITGDQEELQHPKILCKYFSAAVLCADDLLGIARVKGSSLYLWSRKVNAQGVEGWVQCRAIDLRTLLPADDNPFVVAFVIGFAESTRSIFISTDVGIFVIELNSGRVRKVSEPGIYYPVVPFMSFYTPDCACGKLPLPSEKN
ncbi:unnamed protein product [Urochloa decumbens]|uniref:F-box domain-containing protein n=1 Tax=Urochloa decumbens TaxID=240449 RepID=A0ABC9GU95_9POAL